MFGNRLYAWKLAAALALTAGLLALSYRWGTSLKPELWRCLADPESWDGSVVRVSKARVVSVSGDGFVISDGQREIPVRGAARPDPGELVDLSGVFRNSGSPRLELRQLRRMPAALPPRWIVEVVSLVVLVLVILNLLRRFACRPETLRAEVKD